MRVQTRGLADREAKLEAVQQKLTQSVEALVTGEDWKRAMEFAARFRSRSFNNTMLVYVQHYAACQQGRVPDPMPTYVAGFKQWMSLNRHVMKGQSGYAILAPVTARFASSNSADPDSWRRLGRGEKPDARRQDLDTEAGPGGHCGATQESSAVDLPPHIDTSDKPLPGPANQTLRPSPRPRKTEQTTALTAAP